MQTEETLTHDAGAPKELVRKEFANRLQKILFDRRISQSELARRVEATLPEGQTFGRYLISSWVRGKVLPQGENFEALRKALGVPADQLMPVKAQSTQEIATPAMAMRDIGDGNIWIQINRTLDFDTGAKIIQLIREYDAGRK